MEATLISEWKDRLVFWLGAVSVALIAIAFAIICTMANDYFHKLLTYSRFIPLVLSPLGLMAVAAITRRYFAGSQGSGIPQTIAALDPHESNSVREKVLSMRVIIGKMLLTIVSLFCGAAIGREGPTVQVGASIMHKLARFVKTPADLDVGRGLILAGGAAGVAAAFNTPLAGIVFAIEEMGRSFEHHSSRTILMTVIIAGLTTLALLGNYNYFGTTSDTLVFGSQWIVVVVCGAIGGILGGIFSRLLVLFSRGLPGQAGVWMRAHPVQFAGICGLVIGLLGVLSGSTTYGSGYEEAKMLISGKEALPETFGIFKMIVTLFSSASGIPGGLLSPSLSAGAGLGANIAHFFTSVPVGATIILGMVAYFSGVTQAPITSFVIVMEMTGNNTMLLPLMTASFIAYSVSRMICKGSVYHLLSEGFLTRREPAGEQKG